MEYTKEQIIEIQPIKITKAKIKIVGDSPLIMHAWSAKAKREMLKTQLKFTTTRAREAKNPFEDFATSLYWLNKMPEEFTEQTVSEALPDAKFGFPVTAFKQSAITAAYQMGWSKNKTSLRSAFFIEPEVNGYYSGDLQPDFDRKKIEIIPNVWHTEGLAIVHSDIPVMREDMVRVSGVGQKPDIRYRGQFNNWWVELTIAFTESGQVTIDQIVNIFNAGGFACGVGEWRPEKDGIYGTYHVEAV